MNNSIYTINSVATADVIASCSSMHEAQALQSAYNLQSCSYISILPIQAKNNLFDFDFNNVLSAIAKCLFVLITALIIF